MIPAAAHGDVEKTTPKEGARLGAPPGHIFVNFTEAPAQGAVLRVLDGCQNNLVSSPLISERSLHSALQDGEPGRWKVSYRVISAVDGHLTKGSYTFTVLGQKDCSAEPQGEGEDDETEIGPGTGPITPDEPATDDGFPVVPVAIGGGVVLIAAVAIRVFSSRGAA